MEISTPNGKVIRDRWDYYWSRKLPTLVAEILGPHISGTIRVAHSTTADKLHDADFYVLIYSCADGTGSRYYGRRVPQEAFGMRVDATHSAKLSGKGIQIKDEAGTVWAELVDNALYIPHLINYYERRSEPKLFQRILEEVIPYLKPIAQWTPGQETQELSTHTVEQALSAWLERIEARNAEQARLTSELPEGIQSIEQAAHRVNSSMASADRLRNADLSAYTQEAEQDLRRLVADRRIASVTSDNRHLYVFTTDVWGWHELEKERYRFGRFMIQIPFSGKRDGLKVFSTRYRVNTSYRSWRQALHVDEYGTPCWGNSKDTFDELLAARDFIGVVHYMLEFLQVVNTVNDNWGKEFDKWPKDQKPDVSKTTECRLDLLGQLSPELRHLTPEQLDYWLFQLGEHRMARVGGLIQQAVLGGINWEVEWIGKGLRLETLFSTEYTKTLPELPAAPEQTQDHPVHAAV